MAYALHQIRTKVSERERHAPCIQESVAERAVQNELNPRRRPGKRIEVMRKPPTKEMIGTKTQQVESVMTVAASFSRLETIPKVRLEISPMTAAQVSFEALTHSMESSAVLESALQEFEVPHSIHSDQSLYAQRDRVVLEHLPLVRAIAVRVHDNLPVHVDLDDLIHAGIMGLFDAATKFDMEKNVAFSFAAEMIIEWLSFCEI